MTVEVSGFKTFVQRNILLDAEQNVKVDAKLELGSIADTITVSGQAPLVDGRSSTLGATIGQKQITDLPLNGRNVFDLLTLLPGVSGVSAPQTFTGDRSGPSFSF